MAREHICPHNVAVDCTINKCERCGWNPKVAKERKRLILGEKQLYKVPFTGYCEVWADTPDEAADLAEDFGQQFFAHYDYGDPECLEKEEQNELD